MSEELKSCSYCNSPPQIGSLGGDEDNWMIWCEDCKISNAEMGVSGNSLYEIKQTWNSRPREAELEVVIKELRGVIKAMEGGE